MVYNDIISHMMDCIHRKYSHGVDIISINVYYWKLEHSTTSHGFLGNDRELT
jgi:hypothetical protein